MAGETQAVGAIRKERKPAGVFKMDWISVFGAPVPEAWMPSLLLYLDLLGWEVRGRGNTVQVRWDAEDPNRVEAVRELIQEYARDAWQKPPTAVELAYWRNEAEAIITKEESK